MICVTETWIDESVIDNESKLPGFNVIRKDRNRNDGGICIYVKNNLAYTQRNDLDYNDFEAVWCDVLLPKTNPILIGCCYRSPKQYDFFGNFGRIYI